MRDETLEAFEFARRLWPLVPEKIRARWIELRGAWEFVPPLDPETGEPHYPFAFVRDLYERRVAIKAAVAAKIAECDAFIKALDPNDPGFEDRKAAYERMKFDAYDVTELVLKLAINSVYGKCAQQIGGRRSRNGTFFAAPSTACPWYAAAITGGTRAQLMHAMTIAPDAINFAATDGIQSLEPLHIESAGSELGTWEYGQASRAVYIKPGVYAFEEWPKKKIKGKSRGSSVASILGEDIPEEDRPRAWFEFLMKEAALHWALNKSAMTMKHVRLLTFGASTVSEKLSALMGSWILCRRKYAMNAERKRSGVIGLATERSSNLLPTRVARNPTPNEMSAMYTAEWMEGVDDDDDIDFELEKEQAEIAMARFE